MKKYTCARLFPISDHGLIAGAMGWVLLLVGTMIQGEIVERSVLLEPGEIVACTVPLTLETETIDAHTVVDLLTGEISIFSWDGGEQRWLRVSYQPDAGWSGDNIALPPGTPLLIRANGIDEDEPARLTFVGQSEEETGAQRLFHGLNLLVSPQTGQFHWYFSEGAEVIDTRWDATPLEVSIDEAKPARLLEGDTEGALTTEQAPVVADHETDTILKAVQPLTREAAEQHVAEEMAFRKQLKSQRRSTLESVPASKEWNLWMRDHVVLLRKVAEPARVVAKRNLALFQPTHLNFSSTSVQAAEQRVAMVTARVFDRSVSEISWRDGEGVARTHLCDRDFTLLEGVQTFLDEGTQWTVFVIAGEVEKTEPLPTHDGGAMSEPQLNGGVRALCRYYDRNEAVLKQRRIRNDVLVEARRDWLERNPPEPEDTVLNFWKRDP